MKKTVFLLLAILATSIFVVSCENEPTTENEPTYTVFMGYQKSGTGTFSEGIFKEPNSSLKSALVYDDDYSGCTWSEVRVQGITLNFTENELNTVKQYLDTYGTCFIFYTNTSNYYRWVWIIEE